MSSAKLVLFGPALLVFALAGSYFDIKQKKVPNGLVARIFLVSAILNAFYFFNVGSTSWLLFYLAHVAVSAGMALLLWWLGFWKPGDVKFYGAMATLLHPLDTSRFFHPFIGFLLLCIVATLVEAAVTGNWKFEPNFSVALLMPVALSPIMSFFSLNALVFLLLIMLLGRHLRKLKAPLLAFSAVALLLNPLKALGTLALSAGFFLASSIKFKGELPSVPFMSASFAFAFFREMVSQTWVS